MANQVLAICLVQSLGWVFETQERKKAGEQTGVSALGRGTPSDDCDSYRIGFSGLRIECPIAPGTQWDARKPATGTVKGAEVGFSHSEHKLATKLACWPSSEGRVLKDLR